MITSLSENRELVYITIVVNNTKMALAEKPC
jgi:hypothetical protein